jgi:hypothetical protein
MRPCPLSLHVVHVQLPTFTTLHAALSALTTCGTRAADYFHYSTRAPVRSHYVWYTCSCLPILQYTRPCPLSLHVVHVQLTTFTTVHAPCQLSLHVVHVQLPTFTTVHAPLSALTTCGTRAAAYFHYSTRAQPPADSIEHGGISLVSMLSGVIWLNSGLQRPDQFCNTCIEWLMGKCWGMPANASR